MSGTSDPYEHLVPLAARHRTEINQRSGGDIKLLRQPRLGRHGKYGARPHWKGSTAGRELYKLYKARSEQ